MIIKQDKNEARLKRKLRIKDKLNGTAEVPRMCVYRSTAHIYVQLIDDIGGKTLASSSCIAKGINVKGKNKTTAAELVGKDVAAKAKKAGIKKVVFDRNGYIYTGRVKSLADGAREGGLQF
ncbi:MAG: 50S ribosomal protein L18 [Firmicutes bacterium]|nr:50S ribosomal protein L18 [Bacillota bacterium]